MKRLLASILLLVSMTACAGASSPVRHNCSRGGEVCVELRAEEPIIWGEPVTIVVTVTSEKDSSDVGVYLTTNPNSILVQDALDEEPGQVTRKDQSFVNWLVDIKRGQPVTFTRKLDLPLEDGIYRIYASALAQNLRAEESIRIYITREGGKAYLSGTQIPITPGHLPTTDPDTLATLQAMPTETPFLTLTTVPSTETPPPVDQGTPAYPQPETPLP